MTQEATTYTCSKCLLPCEVAVASPLVNRTQEEPLSLCCNAAAEPVRGKKQPEEAT